MLKSILAIFPLMILLPSTHISAHGAAYGGCAEIERKVVILRPGASYEERIAYLEQQFLELVSSPVICEEDTSETSSNSASSSSAGSPSAGDNSGQSSTASVSVQGNIEEPIEEPMDGSSTGSEGVYRDGGGKQHEALVNIDNTAALKSQLQAAIDAEEDPVVKQSLQNELDALK
ncbi:MAG: hypothetical protein V7459_02800 [Oceanicoccus sp.]